MLISRKGFSLLETLIAAGVLVAVVLGTTALSNSLTVSSVVNADKTIINRWASEGIELTEKYRDDTILNKSTAPNWFGPAIKDNGADYGWYKLTPGSNANIWQLTPAISPNLLTKEQFISDAGSALTSDKTIGYRLICVEAISATDKNSDNEFRCNTDADNHPILDGVRTDPTANNCQATDLYCSMSIDSVNKNRLITQGSKITIPSGNAVKIRSVVIWLDKDQVRSSSLATIITNWRGYEQ